MFSQLSHNPSLGYWLNLMNTCIINQLAFGAVSFVENRNVRPLKEKASSTALGGVERDYDAIISILK